MTSWRYDDVMIDKIMIDSMLIAINIMLSSSSSCFEDGHFWGQKGGGAWPPPDAYFVEKPPASPGCSRGGRGVYPHVLGGRNVMHNMMMMSKNMMLMSWCHVLWSKTSCWHVMMSCFIIKNVMMDRFLRFESIINNIQYPIGSDFLVFWGIKSCFYDKKR